MTQLSGTRGVLPWIESPFFERELAARDIDDETRRLARQLHDDGFAVIEQVADHDLLDRVRAAVEPFYDDPDIRRVQDAWTSAPVVLELALLPAVQERLATLYGRRPIPFQTLTFKWGTEQRGHSDTIHFSCLPPRWMCGVWVALEDVDEGNGPLFYYPGSHRLPDLTLYDIGLGVDAVDYPAYEDYQHTLMQHLGIEPVEFHAKKGDALIWSANLVHGGRPVTRTGSTRWSQVTHYYFEGCIYLTPVFSDLVSGELLLKDIVDLNTMETVTHTYNGARVHRQEQGNGRFRIRLEPFDPTTVVAAEVGDPEHLAELERELTAERAEVQALRHSRAYRLGDGLLRPVRRVRSMFNRGARRADLS